MFGTTYAKYTVLINLKAKTGISRAVKNAIASPLKIVN